jgi:mono/diheme cytochrome c family protein
VIWHRETNRKFYWNSIQESTVNRRLGRRDLAAIAITGLGMALFAGFMAQSQQASRQTTAQEADETFQARCSTCHAEHGEGSEVGASLNVPDLRSAEVQNNTDDFLRRVIKNGRGNMPAFGRDFSDQQIDRILLLIRSFAASSSQQAQSQPPAR